MLRKLVSVGAFISVGIVGVVVLGGSGGADVPPESQFRGTGGAAYVTLDATLGPQEIVDLELFPARGDANTAVFPRSLAQSANLNATVLGAIDLSGILTEVEQQTSTAGSNTVATTDTLIPVDANPLLDLAVSNGTAHARWFGDGACPANGVPFSLAHTDVAQADLLDTGGSVYAVSLVNPTGGLAATRTWTEFQDGAGAGRAVRTVAQAQAVHARLFEGTPLETVIDLAGTFEMTAVADGTAGGAATTVTWPVVTITLPGGSTVGPIQVDELDPVVIPVAGALDGVLGAASLGSIRIETGAIDTDVVSSDGRIAEIAGSLLAVDLDISAGGSPVLLADLDLAPLSTAATVPEGGVICHDPPLDVFKSTTATEVNPSEQFDYDIEFVNDTGCTLTDVSITDTLQSAPLGSTINAVLPAATSSDGAVTRWFLGDVPDGGTWVGSVTVEAPTVVTTRTTYINEVVVQGRCEGRVRTGSWVHNGPGVRPPVTTTSMKPPTTPPTTPPPTPTTCPPGNTDPNCELPRGLATTGSGTTTLVAFASILAVLGMIAVGKQRELELRHLAAAVAAATPRLRLRLRTPEKLTLRLKRRDD